MKVDNQTHVGKGFVGSEVMVCKIGDYKGKCLGSIGVHCGDGVKKSSRKYKQKPTNKSKQTIQKELFTLLTYSQQPKDITPFAIPGNGAKNLTRANSSVKNSFSVKEK